MNLQQIPWPVHELVGGLIVLGLLIAFHDTRSNKLTSRKNLGAFMVILAILALVVGVLVPMFPILMEAVGKIWSNSNGITLGAVVAFIVLLLVGVIVHRRYHRP